jgi:prepilin-type N-terminal cleavage/methylation domain-containing protein
LPGESAGGLGNLLQPSTPARHTQHGFSLIEFVGVMAIIAIMAATIAPMAVRQTDKSALSKEAATMSTISNALALQVIRNKAIPDETTWTNVAATWAMHPASQISVNDRGFARAFLIDSGGWFTNYAAGSYYTQTSSGTSPRPASARAMIVSTIARGLPLSSGRPTSGDFNDIWNTPPLKKPSTWTGWNGSGEDLTIQRFNVDSLFHRLILVNRDNSTQPAFSIDSTSALSKVPVVHNSTPPDPYYLDGTVVSLWVGSILTNSFVLNSDISFIFDGGMWRAQLVGPVASSSSSGGAATNFSAFANAFINTPTSNNKGTDPMGVLTGFASFMYAYTIWADECPHFQTAASGYPQTTDYVILGAIEGLLDKAIGYTDSSGLLK